MSQGIANIFLVEGDHKPFLEIEWEDTDITGYTIVLNIRYDDGTAAQVSATVDSAVDGTFHFEWAEGVLRAGTHYADLQVTDGDGLEMTLPAEASFKLIVRERA